ncbi:MAG: cytochrome C oxidase subunit IV family protein [Bdellovibrionales bacterium]|nr:cytochrome C oxidase subunit IV family protein [Bdellovibrionales bacterium]
MGKVSSGSHHIVPFGTYLKVLLVLLFLTALTVLVAKPVSGFDLGVFNTFIAMFVATLKAGLVAAIFMGLKYDSKLNLVVFFCGVFFLILFFSLSYLDVATRVLEKSTL